MRRDPPSFDSTTQQASASSAGTIISTTSGKDGLPPNAVDGAGGIEGGSATASNSQSTRPREARGEDSISRSAHPHRRPYAIIEEFVGPNLERRTLIRSAHIGDTYLRKQWVQSDDFRPQGENELEATQRVLASQSRAGQIGQRIKRTLLGQPLATEQQLHERLTKVKALAVLSSDAISSVAYGTEASLGILIAAGVGALHFNLIIGGLIILLMGIVGTSYFQTIHAYPQGGGSYIVARDNMGDWPGLVAAAALLIDYVLTVSVSVAAGVAAMVSAVSWLAPYSVLIGVIFIGIIMVINLRGIRESGTIFAAPTYLFVGVFLIMILTGVVHAAFSPGGLFTAAPLTAQPITTFGWTPQQFGIVLVLAAFANGCSAMTGVEAISNGVPAFKAPEARNASRTLIAMVAILATLYLGTTYLAWRFSLIPNVNQNPTLDSQIASLLYLHNRFTVWFYYLIQFATTLILVLAANTSFADFPRLSSILARDGFLPHQFSFRGDRLAFSVGIVVLSAFSITLLVVFNGNTGALINLYALGVFTAFTLSQSGMVVHWWRKRAHPEKRAWQRSLLINGVGAIVTGIVALVIMFTKFDRGAWIVMLLAPLLVLLFRSVQRHYTHVRQQIPDLPVRSSTTIRHVAIVPLARFDVVAMRSLNYALSLGMETIGVHVITDQDEDAQMRSEWTNWFARQQQEREAIGGTTDGTGGTGAGASVNGLNDLTSARRNALRQRPEPKLVIIRSPWRALVAPIVRYVRQQQRIRNDPDTVITVLLPEYVPAHWWERLLHNETAFRLKLALYAQRGVVVTNIPYHLGGDPIQQSEAATVAVERPQTIL